MLAPLKHETVELFPLSEAPQKLLGKLKIQLSKEKTKHGRGEKILRIEVPIVETDPLLWLQGQKSPAKTYWADRENLHRAAGAGEAMILQGQDESSHEMILQRIRRMLTHSSEAVRFYGGMRFNHTNVASEEWQAWTNARFVLPEIELIWQKGRSILACNVNMFEIWDKQRLALLEQTLEELGPPKTPSTNAFRYIKRNNRPEHEDWCRGVEQALSKIESGHLKKVVLARSAEFELESEYDPLDLLSTLKSLAPHAYHFCFQRAENRAFLGITPERLYHRNSRQIETEAVASTRPRGNSADEDERLARELLESEKEFREHQMVLERLESLMKDFCQQTSRISFQELLRLRNVQHLQSRLEGHLHPDIGEAVLLPAFHPTPAVCGTPDSEARDLIEELEPFDRGWYAGPVGWISRNGSEFAVALRSGILHAKTLRVYTGAGIVHGSEPESEWYEIGAKLRSWESILEPV